MGARPARTALVAAAILAGGAAVAGAHGLGVATGLLDTKTKTLTKATCTLSGTTVTTDTYVNEANKTQTNGSTTSLVIRNTVGSRRRVFIRFNLGACPSPATLANASVDQETLSLYFTSATGAPRTIFVYRVLGNWTASINWNTQPSYASSPTASFSLPSAVPGLRSADVTLDVNDFLQSAPSPLPPYTATVPNYGWALADTGGGVGTSTLNSSESGGTKPTLQITYAY
jgi:hypothetical protein